MSDQPERLDPEDERDLQAAEYVLGVLQPAQARAVEALALHEPAMATSIAAWELRLAPLADLVEPIAPPPILWRRLALATGLTRAAPLRRFGWDNLTVWRATAGAALAVAASLGFLLLLPPAPAPEPLVAALSPFGRPGATFLVRVGPDGAATVVAVGDTNVPQDRSLQLWAVPPGATTPVSMGLLPASGRARLTIPVPAGTQLLVSQEPVGGSPRPTLPPVLAGTLSGI